MQASGYHTFPPPPISLYLLVTKDVALKWILSISEQDRLGTNK